MQWQTHFGFAIGAFVAMFAPKSQRKENEERQADAGEYTYHLNYFN
jgi:hypothetical protein